MCLYLLSTAKTASSSPMLFRVIQAAFSLHSMQVSTSIKTAFSFCLLIMTAGGT